MNSDLYFRSDAHYYIFILNETDAHVRCKLLGITDDLYYNKRKAKKWMNKIFKMINPDVCNIEGAEEAVMKLNELYDSMTKYR